LKCGLKKPQKTSWIKDYGIGIEISEHKKIFERFYRVGGKSEITYPGFGIGLFISNEIIERHEGHITLKSETGKGAVFTINLPVASENDI
jgi:two-component system CheB/CheR fusion protein